MDVLKGVDRAAVQREGCTLVSAPGLELGACDPAGRAMARRAELLEGCVRGVEGAHRVGVAVALEERAGQHEPRIADLGQVVDAAVEELERTRRMALRLVQRTRASCSCASEDIA